MSAKYVLSLLIGTAVLGTSGCGAVRDLSKTDTDRSASIQAKIADARKMDALACAPKELAMAETTLALARHEAMEYEPAAVVAKHFDLSEGAADRLLAKTRPCYEEAQRRKMDSDGDGVPDYLDQCPNTRRGLRVEGNGCPPDGDKDGVPDELDACSGTPAGVKVNDKGCALDADGDGVADYLDKCPNTPNGVRVDAQGCPTDADGDGVADHLDKCPDTPKGVGVDSQGCALDADGDGVVDSMDKCPNTPKGAPVDKTGCFKDSDGDGLTDWDEMQKYGTDPTKADTDGDNLSDGDEVRQHKTNPTKADTDGGSVPDGLEVNVARTDPLNPKDDVKEVQRAELEVLFASSSADVEAGYLAEIEAVAAFLKEYPQVHVVIEGHTDNSGPDKFNMALSQRRAESIVSVLAEKYGIALSRLKAKGFGETNPIASNDTKAGRAKNRRIYAVMTSE